MVQSTKMQLLHFIQLLNDYFWFSYEMFHVEFPLNTKKNLNRWRIIAKKLPYVSYACELLLENYIEYNFTYMGFEYGKIQKRLKSILKKN
jgi:hypothetical protein